MIKQRSNTAVLLDIGSTKIVCLVAKLSSSGNPYILGIGFGAAEGIKAGMIIDATSAEQAISKVIDMAEIASGEKIQKVYVSMATNRLLSQKLTSEVDVTGKEVSNKDLNKLLAEAVNYYGKHGAEILHTFICDYALDSDHGIKNPVGMYGSELAAEIHILSTSENVLLNTSRCLARCNLEIESYISSSYATGLACLMPDEMAMGVMLLEFGGGTTSVAIFENSQLIYLRGIPLGGVNLTNDIAKCTGISFEQAERIKTLYGSVISTSLDDHEEIEVPADNESDVTIVNRMLLIEIIRARVEEIIELVKQRLKDDGMEFHYKIVIAGCIAQISGMRELLGHLFSTKVRLAFPKTVKELVAKYSIQDVNFTTFNTAIGMLLHVNEHYARERRETAITTESGLVAGIFGRIRKFLSNLIGEE